MRSDASPVAPAADPKQASARFSGNHRGRSPLSRRVLGFGVVLLVAGGWWHVLADTVYGVIDDKWPPLYIAPTVALLAIIASNAVIGRIRRPWRLSRGELLALYAMLVALSYVGHVFSAGRVIGAQIAYPYWRVAQLPAWDELVLRHLPAWLYVSDLAPLNPLFSGGSTLYRGDHVLPWFGPLAIWSGFLLTIVWVMLCGAALLVRPWVENERLAFPGIQVPLAMLGNEGLFRSRPMWVGFWAVVLVSVSGIAHRVSPDIPMVFLGVKDIGVNLLEPPWSVLHGSLFLCFYPWVIGIAYFLPLDLLFSAWFFHLFFYAELVVARLFGEAVQSNHLYMADQSAGAWLALSVLAAWGVRRHLLDAVSRALSRDQGPRSGPLSPRVALGGALIGLGALVLFSTAIGIQLHVAAAFWFIFFFLALGVTRLRAQLGGMHTLGMTNPHYVLARLGGINTVGVGNLGRLVTFFWCTHDSMASPMPNHLEQFKLARTLDVSTRPIAKALLFASVVALPGIYWAWLHLGYQKGMASGFAGWYEVQGHAEWGLQQLQGWLLESPGDRAPRLAALFGMLGFSLLMGWAKSVWIGWPLHPAGMALALDFSMIYLWFPFLLAWLVKLPVLRYGGIRAHRHVVTFMIGMILGDFTIRIAAGAVGIALKTRVLPW